MSVHRGILLVTFRGVLGELLTHPLPSACVDATCLRSVRQTRYIQVRCGSRSQNKIKKQENAVRATWILLISSVLLLRWIYRSPVGELLSDFVRPVCTQKVTLHIGMLQLVLYSRRHTDWAYDFHNVAAL